MARTKSEFSIVRIAYINRYVKKEALDGDVSYLVSGIEKVYLPRLMRPKLKGDTPWNK
jgi:hypothetical protein